MHALEHVLFLLADRIKQETGNAALAEDVLALASMSHDSGHLDDAIMQQINRDWTARFVHSEGEDLIA